MNVTHAQLSPAEIERVTGVGAELQRLWRKRGYLASRAPGHARFDIFDAAALAVRQVLAKRGLSPRFSEACGALAAPMVVVCALMYADGVCDVMGEPDFVAQFEHEYHKDAALICELSGIGETDVRRYLLAFDDDEPQLAENLSEAIEQSGAESGYFVNLDVLGMRIAERSGRPLVTARVGPPAASPAEKRRHVRRVMKSARPSTAGI